MEAGGCLPVIFPVELCAELRFNNDGCPSKLFILIRPRIVSDSRITQYKMKLKVDFPGIGNSLKIEHPLEVVSSMHPPGEQSWDGPPPEVDLPP